MNKHIDQSELGTIVAKQKGTDQRIVDAFIKQLFKDVEKELVSNSSVKIEELGVFRIIKSGTSNRILFLGNTIKQGVKREEKSLINTDSISKSEKQQRNGTGIVVNKSENDRKDKTTIVPRSTNIQSDNISVRAVPTRETKDITTNNNAIVADIDPINKSTITESTTTEATPVVEITETVQTEILTPVAPDKAGKEADKATIGIVQETTTQEQEEKEKRKEEQATYRETLRENHQRYMQNRRNDLVDDYQPVATQKNKSPFLKITVQILAILAVIICCYIVYTRYISESETKLSLENFSELENKDKQNYSCIIITDSDVSLKYLANVYYGNETFWPYIYKANENIVDKTLIIQARSIIKIPKLTVDLVSFNKGELNDKAKVLENEILNN